MSREEQVPPPVQVLLEAGSRRTFAGAIQWPGWCRGGRDEPEALEALLASGPRYARVVQVLGLDLQPPDNVRQLVVAERVRGTATTDFGAPDGPLDGDRQALHTEELRRFVWVLASCFRAFEKALEAAEGSELRAGPRGGGRTLPAIQEHVLQANRAYLQKLAWRPQPAPATATERRKMLEADVVDALTAAAEGRLPSSGPRGGKLWMPRFYVRRVAWHMLDHTWEIEDRLS